MGTGDVPKQKPRQPSEEEILINIRITSDPAKDLSAAEVNEIDRRIAEGKPAINDFFLPG